MKKIAFAALVAAMTCGSANAAVLDFAFTGNEFAGSFSFDDATGELKSINFDQSGKVYDLNTAGLNYNPQGASILGGKQNGVDGVGVGEPSNSAESDFLLLFNAKSLTAEEFYSYTFGSGFKDGSGTATLRNVTGAVPELATWAMMMLGFGFVGYSMRRKTMLRFV